MLKTMIEKKQYLILLTVLLALGMLITAYLVYQHYKSAGGSFCNVSDYVSCDVVNKSKYSEIVGFPVALLGFLAYAIFFFFSIGFLKNWKFPRRTLGVLVFFSAASVLFSLYLTIIEFFVLKALCLLCITQQMLIFFIFFIFLYLWLQKKSFSHSGS